MRLGVTSRPGLRPGTVIRWRFTGARTRRSFYIYATSARAAEARLRIAQERHEAPEDLYSVKLAGYVDPASRVLVLAKGDRAEMVDDHTNGGR